jgi:hypothetical protein
MLISAQLHAESFASMLPDLGHSNIVNIDEQNSIDEDVNGAKHGLFLGDPLSLQPSDRRVYHNGDRAPCRDPTRVLVYRDHQQSRLLIVYLRTPTKQLPAT